VRAGVRHKVGLVADFGIWDVHHAALLVSMGADAVHPWLGCATAGEDGEATYLKGLRGGFVEAMSMMGVTPASAYCGAKLVESVGLDPAFVAQEFPGVAPHLGRHRRRRARPASGCSSTRARSPRTTLRAVGRGASSAIARTGARTSTGPRWCRTLQVASGYAKKARLHATASAEAYREFAGLVAGRDPITILDLLSAEGRHADPARAVEPERRSSGASWCPA
jgi:glutamate synthase domain-containing protein 2